MRNCKTCQKPTPADGFYAGLSSCKDCVKARTRANRAAKIEYYREYDRQRAMEPKRVAARLAVAASLSVEQRRSYHQGYWKRHPERRVAHVAVGNALRDGRLVRQCCEVCAAPETEAHHDDYSKPLDVRWLCEPCHKAHHRMLRQKARAENAA